jgi:hypothetical protein
MDKRARAELRRIRKLEAQAGGTQHVHQQLDEALRATQPAIDARSDHEYVASESNVLQEYKTLASDLSGIDQLQRSIQGSMVPAIGDVRAAEMISRADVYASLASLRASHVLSESVRRGLPGLLSGTFTGLNNYPRMPSDVLKQARTLGYVGLSSSIAQAFEAHGLASANIAAWSLRPVQSLHTPALRSVLRAATTFGPIVVSPDYEDDESFDYHPDLGRFLPETATKSGDATEVEELWDVVVAYAQGIAVHHRTEVLLSVMGNGKQFVIRVCTHPAAASAIGGGISAPIGFEIGGAVGAAIGGVTGPLITYVLTRR